MIPVRMGDEDPSVEPATLGGEHVNGEFAQSRAGIENKLTVPPDPDFHTRSIAAVMQGLITRNRQGTAYPPEFELKPINQGQGADKLGRRAGLGQHLVGAPGKRLFTLAWMAVIDQHHDGQPGENRCLTDGRSR